MAEAGGDASTICERWSPLGGRRLRDRGDELGEFSEVLGGGGEEELVAGAVGTSSSQSVEPEDAFEVREQQLLGSRLTPDIRRDD